MENKLGDFIIKYLKDNTETRKIIKCDDFFGLIEVMGFEDDDEQVVNIMDYLEMNGIDINFHNAKTGDFYRRYRNIEKKVQLSKLLKGSKTETQKLIEKVDSISVKDRPNWLEMYRDDEDNPDVRIPDDENPFQRITDMLTQELRDRVDNEPGISIEEIQEQIDNEILNNNNNN